MKKKSTPFRMDGRTLAMLGAAALFVIAIIAIAIMLMSRGGGKTYSEHYENAMNYYVSEYYESALMELDIARGANDSEDAVLLTARCHMALGRGKKAVQELENWLGKHEGSRARALLTEYRAALGAEADPNAIQIGGKSVLPTAESLVISSVRLTQEELAHIGALTSLKSLSLTSCGISDASFVESLTALESLILSGNEIESVEPLRRLGSLRTLYLDGNPIGSLTPLGEIKSLTTLDIRGREITTEELEALKKALPGCSVFSDDARVTVKELELGGVRFKSDAKDLDLSGRNITDISVLAECKDLQRLDLSENAIEDISVLHELPELIWLNISKNSISDLSALMALRKLEYLDASENALERVTALAALTGLKELHLDANSLGAASGLTGLKELEILSLNECELKDAAISGLSALTKLRELGLEGNLELTGEAADALIAALPDCAVKVSEEIYGVTLGGRRFDTTEESVDASNLDVRSLAGIERLKALRVLILNENPQLSLEGLGAATTIERLELDGCCLKSIKELTALTKLSVLSLSRNSVTDLAPLSALPMLKELTLSENPDLTDISELAACAGLTKLNLAYTSVSDISALSALSSLKELNLEGCPIYNPEALHSLTGLTKLNVAGCGLLAVELDELIYALPNCTIYG